MTTDREGLAAKASKLRDLHRPGEPLVLPNAWDVASALAVVDAGFPVVATSSGAVARTLGYRDEDSMPIDEVLAPVRRIAAAVEVPVTADMEAGYGLDPSDFVDRLVAAGAVGCNLEDTDHHGNGRLVDVSEQAAYIAAVRKAAEEAGVGIVINGRVDVFRFDGELSHQVREAVQRGRAYLDAGADCVYPIRLADETTIGELVAALDAPVNILLSPPAPPIARLAELGVARVSLAAGPFRTAYGALSDLLAELQA